MQEVLEMSKQELERYRILSAIKTKQISQLKGAEMLNLSTRQVRNLLRELNNEGPKGLISRKRGKNSNRTYSSKFKDNILKLIHENYEDYGPTLIQEKLLERHQIKISNETLRIWMIKNHIWCSKQRRKHKHYLRPRRECFGELIQIDGSHHDWFEGRAKKCVLIVFIDDATSKLTSLHFAEGESLDAYFQALEQHIYDHGLPRQLYSDRLSVFSSCKEEGLIHFKHALKLLNIAHIKATTPQAKGRVERVNKTLQDRLIKEMRQRNICSIEEANKYVKEYITMHNKKFSKEPASDFNAHRPLETDLSRILSRYEERTLSNDLSIHFHNKTYQICEELPKKAKIEVRNQRDGQLRLFFKDQELQYRLYEEQPTKLKWKDNNRWPKRSENHPWKSKSFNEAMKEKELDLWNLKNERVV